MRSEVRSRRRPPPSRSIPARWHYDWIRARELWDLAVPVPEILAEIGCSIRHLFTTAWRLDWPKRTRAKRPGAKPRRQGIKTGKRSIPAELNTEPPPHRDYPPSTSRPLWRCPNPSCNAWNKGERTKCRVCYAERSQAA